MLFRQAEELFFIALLNVAIETNELRGGDTICAFTCSSKGPVPQFLKSDFGVFMCFEFSTPCYCLYDISNSCAKIFADFVSCSSDLRFPGRKSFFRLLHYHVNALHQLFGIHGKSMCGTVSSIGCLATSQDDRTGGNSLTSNSPLLNSRVLT